jgi:mannosyltransferase
MAKALPMPSSVIGHGIDTNFFVPGSIPQFEGVNQKKIISVIGRVRKAKGQKVFLEAMAPVLKQNIEWAAVIVGKVDNADFLLELQEIIKVHQVEKQVYFFDETKDILKFYQASTVVVVPSFSEGFSLVCLEAMACGCIVVATDKVGVHPELIQHGQSGFLFPAGDVVSLRDILDTVITVEQTHVREKARLVAMAQWDVRNESEKLAALYLK